MLTVAANIAPARILGGAGNDTIFSRNAIADVLVGGRGTDTAQNDEQDNLRSIETLLP